MTERDTALEQAVTAYGAAEPARQRDPFVDERLALIASERRRRARLSPFARFLAYSPTSAALGAVVMMALLVAPLGPLPNDLAERAPATVVADASALDASRRDEPLSTGGPDTRQLVLLALATGLGVIAVRRSRALVA